MLDFERESIGEKIKRFAYIMKNSKPRFGLTDTYPFIEVDLFFEKLSPEDVSKVIRDLLNGETIRVPVSLDSDFYTSFSLNELKEGEREKEKVIKYFKSLLNTTRFDGKKGKAMFFYDDHRKIYLKNSKKELNIKKIFN